MFKTISTLALALSVSANEYGYGQEEAVEATTSYDDGRQWGYTQPAHVGYGDDDNGGLDYAEPEGSYWDWSGEWDGRAPQQQWRSNNRAWMSERYEPGNVDRFENHYVDIYGAPDGAWGPNGYNNPAPSKDRFHNWDDQGDGFTCHACGGHGCGLCGGYGHRHRNAMWGWHGHTLRKGLGIGHSHNYLGSPVRSSYNKYGHGIGGRYSQRWSNGYGDRYGLNAGGRYGLAFRWGQYNGYGARPTAAASHMGYGYGSNARY